MPFQKFKRPLRHKIFLGLAFILPLIFTTTLLTTMHLIRLVWIRFLFHPILLQRKIGRKTPKNYGMAYENIVLKTKDGLHLSAWLIPATKRSQKTIILCHGIVLSKSFFLDKINYLHKAGYNILMLDLRAHGRSEGDFVTFGLNEQMDLDAAIDFLKEYHEPWLKKLAVLGHSMGAAAAIFTAVRRKEIQVMVLINCFANIEKDIAHWVTKLGHLPYWPFVQLGIKSFKKELKADLKKVSPLQAINVLKIPIFFINSENDKVTNPKDSELLYKQAQGIKEFWRIPNAKHENFYEVAGKEFEKRVLSFYNKNM